MSSFIVSLLFGQRLIHHGTQKESDLELLTGQAEPLEHVGDVNKLELTEQA